MVDSRCALNGYGNKHFLTYSVLFPHLGILWRHKDGFLRRLRNNWHLRLQEVGCHSGGSVLVPLYRTWRYTRTSYPRRPILRPLWQPSKMWTYNKKVNFECLLIIWCVRTYQFLFRSTVPWSGHYKHTCNLGRRRRILRRSCTRGRGSHRRWRRTYCQ